MRYPGDEKLILFPVTFRKLRSCILVYNTQGPACIVPLIEAYIFFRRKTMKYQKHRHRTLLDITLLVFIAFLLPISFHCIEKPLEPIAPTWPTQLTIPIMDRTYYFGDVINKDSKKFDTTGTTILYKPIATADNYKQTLPEDVFQMPSPRGNTISQAIGAVPVHLDTPPTISVGAAQLGLSEGAIPPLTPDPPPATVNENFGDSTAYKWLIYDSGQMRMTVTNNFQFAIQFVGNTVQLVNLDDTNQVVGTFTFSGQIPAGTTAQSDIVPLSGTRMYAGLKIKTSIQIIGWAGTTISSGDDIVSSLNISNGLIQSALINKLNFNDTTDVVNIPDSSVQLDDSIKVKIAKFQSGSMNILINNNTAFDLTVEFKIPELINTTTTPPSPFKLNGTNSDGFLTIAPHGQFSQTVLMKDVDFVSRNRSGNDTLVTQYLHFTLALKTLSAGAGYAVINSSDFVVADVQPAEPFVLQEVQGKVPPTYMSISKEINAGIGSIGANLSLSSFQSDIQLTANAFSSGLFPTDMFVRIYAVDEKGNLGNSIGIHNQDDITNGRNYHRITPGVEDKIVLVPDSINYLMNSFVATENQLPAKFIINGYAIIDPVDVYTSTDPQFGVGIGGVKQDDSLTVALDYSLPVKVAIQDGSIKDTTSFSQSNIDTTLINAIKSGNIFFEFTNSFPVDINLKVNLLKANPFDSSMAASGVPPVLSIPQDTINYPSIEVPSSTDTINVPRIPSSKFTFIALSEDDAAKFPLAAFAAIDMGFYTGKNQGVIRQFYKSDKIQMKVYAKIVFNVDINKFTK